MEASSIGGVPTEREVVEFSREVDNAWARGEPVRAFGVHFALEFLAANMHKAFFSGVQTLEVGPDDIEYFRIHSTAEDEHSRLAEEGMHYLAREESNAARLSDGVQVGTKLVETLLNGLQRAYCHSVD